MLREALNKYHDSDLCQSVLVILTRNKRPAFGRCRCGSATCDDLTNRLSVRYFCPLLFAFAVHHENAASDHARVLFKNEIA